MKCAEHYDMDAVATCVDCGVGLCPECAKSYSIPICKSCNEARVEGEKGEITKNIILTLAFFAVGFYLGFDVNIVSAIMLGYVFAGIPWGWSFLNKITPSIFLFLPLIGWVIYFLIKGFLSLMIGFIALPVKLFMMYRDSKRLNNISQTFTQKVE